MGYRNISPDMKQRALQLLDQGWEIERIADVLGVSSKSIGRWLEKYAAYGRVDPPSVLRGRPRLLNVDITEDLRELISETPSLYLDEIREWLAIYYDQPISITALHNHLNVLGLTRKVTRKIAAERDDAARAAWFYDISANYSADQLVFLDESSKDGRTLVRKYGCAPSGEVPVERVIFDRGLRYSILPALTLDGYMAVRVVEGSIDGSEFYDFVLNDVVSFFPLLTSY
jgi:transposase